MPELPEVEALAQFLSDRLTGRVVGAVEVVAFAALKTVEPPITAMVGRTFLATTRRGKFLDLDLGELHLVVHLARAGWVRWVEAPSPSPVRPGRGPLALRVRLEEGGGLDITEAGTKKSLAAYLVREPEEVPGIARLGLDPLDPAFSLECFSRLLKTAGGQAKSALTEQSVIAGVGNAYSDEALHRARLSPFKPVGRLTEDELARLYAALLDCLGEALERARGLAAKELKDDKRAGMKVHGRTGLPCPDCGDTVRQVAYSDKSLQYCPTCQTGGKALADRRLSRLLK